MRISKAELVLTGRDAVFLQWEVEDMRKSPSHYETQVRHSRSQSGPWEVIARGLRDSYSFRHTISLTQRWSPPFYHIDIIDKDTGDVAATTKTALYPTHPPDMKMVGLRLRLEQYLRGAYGVEVYFLKVRVEGEIDTDGYDPELGRITGRRGTSFGNKYKGGFYNPMHLWAKIGIDPWITQALNIGTLGVSQSSCWVASVPLLTPGDMIVERYTNKRWRVGKQVQRFAFRQTLFRQACLLDQIPINDPEYDVEIATDELDGVY